MRPSPHGATLPVWPETAIIPSYCHLSFVFLLIPAVLHLLVLFSLSLFLFTLISPPGSGSLRASHCDSQLNASLVIYQSRLPQLPLLLKTHCYQGNPIHAGAEAKKRVWVPGLRVAFYLINGLCL